LSKKILVIVESPKKARKIQSYLTKEYHVMASMGHVTDLPTNKLSIDIKNDFQTKYEVMDGKENIKKDIQKAVLNAKEIILMGDPDREGHAISVNIAEHIIKTKVPMYRASTNKITLQAVKEAINKKVILQKGSLYEAYEARRILDRIVGYKCSFITQTATGGKSVGRCQSVALKIIADREKEIRAFVPIVYWPIEAEIITKKMEKIAAVIKLPKPLDIPTQAEANKIIAVLKKGPVKVSKYEQKETKQNAYAPFTTTTMMQAASSVLSMSLGAISKTSQSLYEQGHITYHRTDSVVMDVGAVNDIRSYVQGKFAATYLPTSANIYANKSKHAQESHECVRPIDLLVTNVTGSADEQKLYKLIWKRAVSSQMSPAKYERRSAEFGCGKYILSATGSKELFDGFRAVWTYGGSQDSELVKVSVGDLVNVIDCKTERKETQPPNRYTAPSLIGKLEKEGIGRPSTMKTIIQTIIDRQYVEQKSKAFHATELGIRVCDFLEASKFCFIDIGFTSDMESKLDGIENKEKNKLDVLKEFWDRLKTDLANAKNTKEEMQKTEFDCPKCAKKKIAAKLVKKHSKFGAFFSCENYKKDKSGCDYTAKVGDDGKPIEKVKKVVKKSGLPCPKCGADLVVRKSSVGEFLGCENYRKGCKGIYDMQGIEIKTSGKKKKTKWKKWKK